MVAVEFDLCYYQSEILSLAKMGKKKSAGSMLKPLGYLLSFMWRKCHFSTAVQRILEIVLR